MIMIRNRMTDKMCSNDDNDDNDDDDDDDDDDGDVDVDAILRIRCNANDVENVPIHPSGSPISDPPIFFIHVSCFDLNNSVLLLIIP